VVIVNRKFILIGFLGFFIVCSVSAAVPSLSGYVTDEVGVLRYSGYYDDIIWVCETLERTTSCVLAVLVVNSTDGQDIALYATEVFNENGIGVEDKDNGVLIVLAIGDGSYFVNVGRGLEGFLNDAKVGRFARDSLVPYLEMGEFGYGVYLLALDIGAEIEELYEYSEPVSYPIEWIPLEWPELLVAGGIFVVLLVVTKGRIVLWIGPLLRSMGRGRSGGGGAGGRWR
jgi:uncharacterized protein